MNTKFFLVVSLVLVVCLPFVKIRSMEPANIEMDVKDLMKQKLRHSQKILEAIATNDFDGLAKHADELIILSKEAEWKVIKTPRYETYSNDFRRNAEALVQSAKEKNLDAAALAYVDLTLNCVKCHKHVREVRMTQWKQNDDPAESAQVGNAN
jgi:hypothetical protein